MNIIGNGVDIVKNQRIQKALKNKNFLSRIYSKKEISESKKIKNKVNFFAKRFAAKEAFVKAIGLGFRSHINYKDILAKIPNTASTTNIIFEDSSDRIFKTRKYFGPVRISKIRIRLLDDFGRVVNLNGGDLIITLEIETLDMTYKNFRQ